MRVIVVGGFLGAGKTTLLAQAARHFAAQGKRVGIITNDQAADLVDTHFLAGLGITVEEVSGGCFCCRFEDLEKTASHLLKDMQPDVLLSEPVGSCMDISATVLQPMKQKWGESLAAGFSFGLIQLLGFIVICIPLFYLGMLIDPWVGIALAVAGMFIIMAIISSVQTIFVSAVYHNITNGDVTEHFNQQLVDDLFVRK